MSKPTYEELEAQCAVTREALESLAYSDGHFRGECSSFKCHPTCEKARKALSGKAGKALLEWVATLEAVAEAAKEYVEQCRCTPSEIGWKAQEICTDKVYLHGTCPRVKLQKALAKLEGEKDE